MTFTATHSASGFVLTSAAITVNVRNNCDDGSVVLNNLSATPVIPYGTKPTLTKSEMTSSMLSEQKCIVMSTSSTLNFRLKQLLYGTSN
jgi:hypothetical protein